MPCVETILQNIRCFIVYIVVIVLDSFRKQCIVSLFFALEYEDYPKFVAILISFVIAVSFIEIFSS